MCAAMSAAGVSTSDTVRVVQQMKAGQFLVPAPRVSEDDASVTLSAQLMVNHARFMQDFRNSAVVRFLHEKVS